MVFVCLCLLKEAYDEYSRLLGMKYRTLAVCFINNIIFQNVQKI